MQNFPMTQIGGYDISRMIIGTNTFFGYSHFSAAKDVWLRRYFTDERIHEMLVACVECGLNATVSMPMERYRRIMDAVEKQAGRHIIWFATPGGATKEELKDNCKLAADLGAEFCMPHTSYTDTHLNAAENIIYTMDEIFEHIRKLGMKTGFSTHLPGTLITGEKGGYDPDCYILPLNSIGFLCLVETDWQSRIIRQCPKPVICIKPLGAGRILPPTALDFVYRFIKPIDTVCVGMTSPEEVRENTAIALECLEGLKRQEEMTFSRSKQQYIK